jgi:hypothetical protein
MRTVIVDHAQHLARAIIVLDRPTLITEIKLGGLPCGDPAVPRLRILINGRVAAESYWQNSNRSMAPGECRYVYPCEPGAPPQLFPRGAVEFRVQARDYGEVQVPLRDEVEPGWTYERSDDGGKSWQPMDGALPISLRRL